MTKQETPIEELIKNLSVRITDENQNKWHVLEVSDVENLVNEHYLPKSEVKELIKKEIENAHTEGQAYLIRLDKINHGRHPIASIGYAEQRIRTLNL
jgi:LEA14-like dessication related protein